MAQPVRFRIAPKGGVWSLTRDDQPQGDYSRLAQATHDAVARARELQRSGQPASVEVQAHDKVITVDISPEAPAPDVGDADGMSPPARPA